MPHIRNRSGRDLSADDTMSDEARSRSLRDPADRGRWRWCLAAAAVAGLMIVSAFLFGFWELPGCLTGVRFRLSSATKITEPQETAETGSSSHTGLREALQAQDISAALAPVWFPEGYQEGEIRFTQTPSRKVFMMPYLRGDEIIMVRISHYSDADSLYIVQSDAPIEIYESDGVAYHIFGAGDELQAVWLNEGFECFISGPLTISEMERMIDSIAGGQGH